MLECQEKYFRSSFLFVNNFFLAQKSNELKPNLVLHCGSIFPALDKRKTNFYLLSPFSPSFFLSFFLSQPILPIFSITSSGSHYPPSSLLRWSSELVSGSRKNSSPKMNPDRWTVNETISLKRFLLEALIWERRRERMLDFQPYFWPQCSSSGVPRMQSNAGFCLFQREGLLSTLPTLTSRESAVSKFVAVAFVRDRYEAVSSERGSVVEWS